MTGWSVLILHSSRVPVLEMTKFLISLNFCSVDYFEISYSEIHLLSYSSPKSCVWLIQLLNKKAKFLKFLIFNINLSDLYITMHFPKCDFIASDNIQQHFEIWSNAKLMSRKQMYICTALRRPADGATRRPVIMNHIKRNH